MTVRKGTKVHPATFELVRKLKDNWGLTYEDLSDLLDVTPSRVQQIVLHQRKKGIGHVDISPSSEQAEEWSTTLT
jgi:antitoxin component HigA of HigAB toxin-antitoxin module